MGDVGYLRTQSFPFLVTLISEMLDMRRGRSSATCGTLILKTQG
jgi:hypothetical protein